MHALSNLLWYFKIHTSTLVMLEMNMKMQVAAMPVYVMSVIASMLPKM